MLARLTNTSVFTRSVGVQGRKYLKYITTDILQTWSHTGKQRSSPYSAENFL